MRLKFIFLIFSFCAFLTKLSSQGLNNDFPIDSIDIKNVFNLLGVEVFKFPLEKQTGKCKLRIIEEKYINHKLIDRMIATEGLEDEYISLNDKAKILRVYKNKINDSTIGIVLNLDYVSISQQFYFDKDTIGMQQCRAYSDFEPVKGKTKPIFIWYAFGKGRIESMHCPGNSPIETVVELYDFVVAVLIEIEEIK